jgi:putative ABC transport system substrate-binding protein
MPDVRRREFIALLGSAAAAWPFAARAQQSARAGRIAVLSSIVGDEPEARRRVAAVETSLDKLGWSTGRNLRIDCRWAAGDASRLQPYAADRQRPSWMDKRQSAGEVIQ